MFGPIGPFFFGLKTGVLCELKIAYHTIHLFCKYLGVRPCFIFILNIVVVKAGRVHSKK